MAEEEIKNKVAETTEATEATPAPAEAARSSQPTCHG